MKMEILAGAHQNNKQGFRAHSLVSKLDQIYIFYHYSCMHKVIKYFVCISQDNFNYIAVLHQIIEIILWTFDNQKLL